MTVQTELGEFNLFNWDGVVLVQTSATDLTVSEALKLGQDGQVWFPVDSLVEGENLLEELRNSDEDRVLYADPEEGEVYLLLKK